MHLSVCQHLEEGPCLCLGDSPRCLTEQETVSWTDRQSIVDEGVKEGVWMVRILRFRGGKVTSEGWAGGRSGGMHTSHIPRPAALLHTQRGDPSPSARRTLPQPSLHVLSSSCKSVVDVSSEIEQ